MSAYTSLRTSICVSSVMHSMPWVFKMLLLSVNVYFYLHKLRQEGSMHPADNQGRPTSSKIQKSIVVLVLGEFILMMSSILPSLVFSVPDRRTTTKIIVFQIFFHINIYMLSCLMMRERNLFLFLHVALQFMYMHYHYWQAKILHSKSKILLFGRLFSFLHALSVITVPSILLFVGGWENTESRATQEAHAHHLLWWMFMLFLGEIASTVAYVEAFVLNVGGEIYENLFNAVV